MPSHKTDPLRADSDDDDLTDGAEVTAGTNPLRAEVRTTTATQGTATVVLTGDASLAEHFRFVDMAQAPAFTGVTGQVGKPFQLELSLGYADRLQRATVSASYADA